MTPGNYLEHAAEIFWSKFPQIENSGENWGEFLEVYKRLIPLALKAPRFLLPDYGIAITDDLSHLVVPIRLPYPCIVLEYVWHNTKVALIAEESRPIAGSDSVVVSVCGFIYGDRKTWVPFHILQVVNTPRPPTNQLGVTPFDLITGCIVEQSEYNIESTEGWAVYSVLSLVQALQCCNVETETIPAPKALNKKRIENNKLPFVEYKILTVGDERVSSAYQGGSHASPRQHLRRGHIRRLPDARTVWVNQCTVGNPQKGVIVKDYRVNA